MNRTLLATLTVLFASASAHAFELKRDSTGTEVRWAGAAHFVLSEKAADALHVPRVEEAVAATIAAVRASAPDLEISYEVGATQGVGYDLKSGARNRSEIVVPEEWDYDERAIAVTVVTIDTRTHTVIDADIAFNAVHRKFGILPPQSRAGGVLDDVQNTLTHELGHALGLGHNPESPESIMYPSALRGEVTKRTLSPDDVAGLKSLSTAMQISQATSALSLDEQVAGCSATGADASLGFLALVLPLLLKRRKTAAALAVLLPGLALATDPVRAAAPVKDADVVVTAEVVAVRTLAPSGTSTLFVSEVEVDLRDCLKGACPKRMVVRVPGGRWGSLEQTVEGAPVPAQGAVLGITVKPGRTVSAAARSASTPSPRATSIYRLDAVADFAAFATGLSDAGWKGTLKWEGSSGTPTPAATRSSR